MFATTTFALLAVLAQAPAPAAQQPAPKPVYEISLREASVVRGLDVLVTDLVDIAPLDEEALRIGELVFGAAPQNGYLRTVTRAEVLQALVRAGYPATGFRVRGAGEIAVQAAASPVEPARLVEAATVVLEALLQKEGGDVEFEPAAQPRTQQLPPGRRSQELRARVRGGSTLGTSTVTVDVEVLVDDRVAKTVPVQFRLTRYQLVAKTAATIPAGTQLDGTMVELSRERVEQAVGLYLSSLDQVQGKVAARNLQPGRILMLADLAEPALIRRGEPVTVISTAGRVKVTTQAHANHDAARGAVVSVTCASTGRQITGVAEASSTVVVRN